MKWPYHPYEALLAPARPKAQVWRLAMGIILVAGVVLLCNQIAFGYLRSAMGSNAPAFFAALDSGSTPLAMIILLLSFGFIIVGVGVAVRVAHLRGLGSVLGDLPLSWRQFRDVLVLLVLLNMAVFVLPPWGFGGELALNMAVGKWLVFLPFGLIAIFVQVSAEEVLFRGYLQQQLAARFSSPLVWILVPSALFGVGHYMPVTAGDNAVLIALWATAFGIMMADLTARAGTLGPAIAIHLVNNVTAILFVSLPGELSGLALYLVPFEMSDTAEVRAWLPVDFMMMVTMWLTARLALRR
ncbi:MAG: lysostaphin resistance A-like protein [Roseobacter sp.]